MEEHNTYKKLIIITKSNRADPYINVIGHCKNFFKIEEIEFWYIMTNRNKIKEYEKNLEEIRTNITRTLTQLGDGKYNGRDINLSKEARNYYKDLLPYVAKNDRVIAREHLVKEISKLISGKTNDYLFDGTVALKEDLIDLFSILLSISYRHLYTFEITKDVINYSENELIYALGSAYKYRNLTDTALLKNYDLIEKSKINKIRTRITEIAKILNK